MTKYQSASGGPYMRSIESDANRNGGRRSLQSIWNASGNAGIQWASGGNNGCFVGYHAPKNRGSRKLLGSKLSRASMEMSQLASGGANRSSDFYDANKNRSYSGL